MICVPTRTDRSGCPGAVSTWTETPWPTANSMQRRYIIARGSCSPSSAASPPGLTLVRPARLVGRQRLARDSLVAAPPARHLERRRFPSHGERQAEGEGRHALALEAIRVGLALFCGPRARGRQLVALLGPEQLPARSQHADQVAVTHGPLVKFFRRATGRTEQVTDDDLFEFGAQLA